MMSLRLRWFTLVLSLCSLAALTQPTASAAATAPPSTNQVVVTPPKEETALTFDATVKEYVAKPGDQSCTFRFTVINTSDHEVVINQVRTSCGCTIAKLPSQPWHLQPGDHGYITLVVDLHGQTGVFVKSATVDLPTTYKTLLIKVTMPTAPASS